MDYESRLIPYLEQIAAGDRSLVPAFLEILADTILFVPVTRSEDIGDGHGAKRVRLATLPDDSRRIIPVFTSEERFLNWSNEQYQCLPLSGGDLALTLGKDTSLRLNPGATHSFELEPEEVMRLATIEPTISEPAIDEIPEQGEVGSDPQLVAAQAEHDRVVLDALSELLAHYSEVREAYFLRGRADRAEGILGLLCEGLLVEKRFLLISEIAEISRAHYGFAGSIETYDDLSNLKSNSWELFKALAPFYVRNPSPNDTSGAGGAGRKIRF